MGIKSFFQGIGRGLKKGWDTFVSKAGNAMGTAGTFLQRKAIPAIASVSNTLAGGIGKAMPLIAGVAPELAGPAEEAQNVLSKVGGGVGKFADFIGSNAPQGRVATADEINKFRSQIPQGKSFFGIKPLPAPVDASAIRPAVMPANPNPLKIAGLIKPLIGSNPASYSPMKSSAIEAPPAQQTNIIKAGGGGGGPPMLAM